MCRQIYLHFWKYHLPKKSAIAGVTNSPKDKGNAKKPTKSNKSESLGFWIMAILRKVPATLMAVVSYLGIIMATTRGVLWKKVGKKS